MTLTVAVVIPTIPGREEMLEAAVASVRAQTRQATQLIIEVDKERTGAAQARNRALQHVTTDLVCWLDDDDRLLPNHIERLAKVLESSKGIDLVYPIPEVVGGRDPTATSLNGRWVLPWRVPFGEEQKEHLIQRGSFIPITHMVRTEKVRAVGGFPQPGTPEWPYPNVEDWGYLIRLLNAGANFYHLPVTTWRWNVDPNRGATGGQPDR